ncbi:MAG: hypothetical protein ACLP9Y_33480 [Mycobacterium sp.]
MSELIDAGDTIDDLPAREELDATAIDHPSPKRKGLRAVSLTRALAFVILPAIALALGAITGYLRWQDNSLRDNAVARADSLAVAQTSVATILSYQPGTVEQQLTAARDLLTDPFLGSYTQLTHDVVIPGAKQKQISSVATVPAATSVSVSPRHAVALVFVDQMVTIGSGAPSATTSSIRVTLGKIGGKWLISRFDPV